MFEKSPKDNDRLELISVHIPKCAGTSFRLMLKHIYGESKVARVDIPIGEGQVRLNESKYTHKYLPSNIRAIHGHFNPTVLRQHFELDMSIPCITWLRHPVERVISNYYYLDYILRKHLDEEKNGLNILVKMERSLLEYSKAKRNRNRISKFVEGTALSDFNFIGIVEDFTSEVNQLQTMLGWENNSILKVNETPSKRREVSQKIKSKIENWNIEDMRLYDEALNLREKRADR